MIRRGPNGILSSLKTGLCAAALFLGAGAPAFSLSDDADVYVARPESGDGPEETVEARFAFREDAVLYASTTTAADQSEYVRLRTDPDGNFREADQTVLGRGGAPLSRVTVRALEGGKSVRWSSGGAEKTFYAPDGHRFAVGPSLLILLRVGEIPPGEGENVYLIDFTGHAVRARIENAGPETVATAEGPVRSRRMRVTLSQFLWQSRMDFWFSDDARRRLVRHRGRRGFLSKTYVSELAPANRPVP